MAWPVRINGHVYTEDMFFGWGYQTALPSMIDDVAIVAQGVQDTADNVALIANTVSQDADSVRVALQEATQLIDTVVNNPNTLATTSTPITISSGIKTFTIQPGKSYVDGMIVLISSTDNPEYYLSGTVTAYNPTTGEMSVNAEYIFGSGTYSSWNVTVTGVPGLEGSISELVGTSTTSLTVTIGSKTLNVGTGKSYSQGMSILVAVANNNQVYMYGLVDSYNQSNGTLVFTCEQVRGSGTYANWNISISGVPGPDPTSVDIYGQSEYITLTTASRNITTDNKRVISVSANDWNYSLNLPNPSADLQGVRWTITNEGVYPVFIKNGSKWLGKLYPKTSVIVSVKVVSGTYKYTLAYSDGIKRSIMVEDVKTPKYVSATVDIASSLLFSGNSVENRMCAIRSRTNGIFCIATGSYIIAGKIDANDNITFGTPSASSGSYIYLSPTVSITGALLGFGDGLWCYSINESSLAITAGEGYTSSNTYFKKAIEMENLNMMRPTILASTVSLATNVASSVTLFTMSIPPSQFKLISTGFTTSTALRSNNVVVAKRYIPTANQIDDAVVEVSPLIPTNNPTYNIWSAIYRSGTISQAGCSPMLPLSKDGATFSKAAALYPNPNVITSQFYTEFHFLYYPERDTMAYGDNVLLKSIFTMAPNWNAATTLVQSVSSPITITGPDKWDTKISSFNEASILYNDKILLMNDAYSKAFLIDAYSKTNQSDLPWDHLPQTCNQSALLFIDNTRFIVFYLPQPTSTSAYSNGKVCYALGHINPDD